MKKLIYLVGLLYFLLICSTEGEARRIIGRTSPPAKLYLLPIYLYESIEEGKLPENFTMQDVVQLTGWSYNTVRHKILLLSEIEVLEVINPDQRSKYYRFKQPFKEKENLELLASIYELHKARYEDRKAVVPIIKEKIATILDAKKNLNIKLSFELESEFPELKRKFLIAIGYRGLTELFKSFSSIGLRWGEKVGLNYDGIHNIFTLYLSPEEIEKAFAEDVWDLFWYYSGLRRNVSLSLLQEETSIESTLYQFMQKVSFETTLQADEFLKGLLHLIGWIANIRELPYSSELYKFNESNVLPYDPAVYGLNLLESFFALRSKEEIQPLYKDFISKLKEAFSTLIINLLKLNPLERNVLLFRYFKNYSIADIAKVLNVSKERVHQIVFRAWEELQHPVYKTGLLNSVREIEEIFHQLYTILFLAR